MHCGGVLLLIYPRHVLPPLACFKYNDIDDNLSMIKAEQQTRCAKNTIVQQFKYNFLNFYHVNENSDIHTILFIETSMPVKKSFLTEVCPLN